MSGRDRSDCVEQPPDFGTSRAPDNAVIGRDPTAAGIHPATPGLVRTNYGIVIRKHLARALRAPRAPELRAGCPLEGAPDGG